MTNEKYKYCPSISRPVSTRLTEGQCRDLNCCGDAPCPLEDELGEASLNQPIVLLASSFAITIASFGPKKAP
jgi:hypothetical protein